MELELLQQFLLWCLALNYGILLIWFIVFSFAKQWIKSLHGRWFALTDQSFDAIHYASMAVFKILIFIFNLAPIFAIYMIRN